jgi:phage gp16-like protein
MPARQVDRRSELAVIHIAKKQLGLDDETYRAVIRMISNGKTDSSADLDHVERSRLLDHLKAKGFKKHTRPKTANVKAPQIEKIEALLASQKLPWSYADGVAKQMFGRDKLEWCSGQELRAVIVALTKRQSRKEGEQANG